MAQYTFPVTALRPAQGTLAKLVGTSALTLIAQIRSGGLTMPQLQVCIGEAIDALQDQINAINTLAKMIQQTVTVDGSVLPFTPPGGSSGDIQTNNGAGGFAGLASTGTGNAVRANSPTIVTPTIASFTNAQHNHQNAAGGGTLDGAAIASGKLGWARIPAAYRSQAYKAAVQNIPDATATALVFDTNKYDVGGIHSTSVDNSRFTANVDGVFDALGQCSIDGSAALDFEIYRNGAPVVPIPDMFRSAAGVDPTVQVAQTFEMTAGQYIEFIATQISGGALDTAKDYTWGQLIYRGPLT